jgi:hypothetical protein
MLLQVSDIPGVVHMVEYYDMGDSIWIVLERGDHTKVSITIFQHCVVL